MDLHKREFLIHCHGPGCSAFVELANAKHMPLSHAHPHDFHALGYQFVSHVSLISFILHDIESENINKHITDK